MTRREQLAYMLGLIDHGGKIGLRKAAEFALGKGIRSDTHVGVKPEKFTEEMKAEHLMGQFIDLSGKSTDTAFIFAFNALYNMSMSLLNYKPEEENHGSIYGRSL